MPDRAYRIAAASKAADDALAAKPPQRATTSHIVAAALPTIVHEVLEEVRRAAIRSMAPAQIREMCNQIERGTR